MRHHIKTRVHKPYPISDQNGQKTIPFDAAHTYIAHKRDTAMLYVVGLSSSYFK